MKESFSSNFGSELNAAFWGKIYPYVEHSGQLKGLEVLQMAEAVLFDFLWYPQPETKDGKLISYDDTCKIQLEWMFDVLKNHFENDPENPIYLIIKRHERRYRLLSRNKPPRFYNVALTWMFFYFYEANLHLNEPNQIGGFLKHYL